MKTSYDFGSYDTERHTKTDEVPNNEMLRRQVVKAAQLMGYNTHNDDTTCFSLSHASE